MRTIFKSTVTAVTVLVVALTLIVFNAQKNINLAAEETQGTHSHRVCGNLVHDDCTHTGIEFEPFPENNEIIRNKSYYLTKDIVLDDVRRIYVEKGITNICLNGHCITKEGGQIIDINNIDGEYAELNICDCKGNGKIINTSESEDSTYACISVIDHSALNIYGGTVDGGANGAGIQIESNTNGAKQGGSANIYGGTIQTVNECAVWLSDPDTSLSVYGGKIYSSKCTAISVCGERSKALIDGGEVIGNAAKYETIYICGEEAAVTINGGSVVGKIYRAAYCEYGTLNITGGEVIGNAANYETIYICGEKAAVTISGGSVVGKIYRAAYCEYGTLNITGGEVKSENNKGSAIYNADTLALSGGTVACCGYYGIYNLEGGNTTISGGKLESDGSAIYNNFDGEVKIEGGDISSEKYSGIYNYGSLIIEDGKIACKDEYAIRNYGKADLKISGGELKSDSSGIYNYGSLIIEDGKIACKGDNPVVNNGTLSISGGSFGGAGDSEVEKYIKNNGVLNLSGSPTFNNTSLWLASDDNIEITGEITIAPCKVYINSSVPRIFTSGWSTYMGNKNPSDYFESPYKLRIVGQIDGEAVLRPFMITFNTNGGTCETASTFVDNDRHALLLPEASRKGYIFDGWFTAEENGEKVTAETIFTGDIELYAYWSECEHVWDNIYESDSAQHWKVCKKCGMGSEKTNHQWDDGVITKQPTADETGEKILTCTVCGKTKTEIIPSTGGTENPDPDNPDPDNPDPDNPDPDNPNPDNPDPDNPNPDNPDPDNPDPDNPDPDNPDPDNPDPDNPDPDNPDPDNPDPDKPDPDNPDPDNPDPDNPDPVNPNPDNPDPDKPDPDNPDPDKPNPDNPDPDNPDPDKPKPDNPDPDNPDPDNPDPDKPDPDNPDPDNPDPDNPDPDNPDPDKPEPDNPDPDNPDPDNPDPDKPDPDKPENPDDTDNGSISKEVQPGENAPDTELETPLDELIEAVLTPEEQELVNDGIDIKIMLTVEDGTDSTPAEDKEKVETAISELPDYKIGQYLDVNLLKIIGNSEEKITETNAPITLVFVVPEALRGEGRTYSVIRVHNGETAILADLDSDINTVTIETDKFSTYALVYSEKTSVTTPVGNFTVPGESGSGSGDPVPSESKPADGRDPAPSGSEPADSGNTITENDGSSDNGTTLPSSEASSTNDSGTNSDSGNVSADNNNFMSGEGADTDNNTNPRTGIAISLIPLMAITVITAVSVKSKKK